MTKRVPKFKIPDPGAERGKGEKPTNKGQIKKGEKRNPLGRPVGSKNKQKPITNAAVRDIILADNRRKETVQDASGPITLTMLEIAIRSLGIKAARGGVLAMRFYLELSRWADRDLREGRGQLVAGILEYKLKYEEVKHSYARRRQKVPPWIIDGDSFILGPNGLAGMRDAATKDDIVRWKEVRDEQQAELAASLRQLERAKGRDRVRLEKDISHIELVLQAVAGALGGDRTCMWVLDQALEEAERRAAAIVSSTRRRPASRRPRRPGTKKPDA